MQVGGNVDDKAAFAGRKAQNSSSSVMCRCRRSAARCGAGAVHTVVDAKPGVCWNCFDHGGVPSLTRNRAAILVVAG